MRETGNRSNRKTHPAKWLMLAATAASPVLFVVLCAGFYLLDVNSRSLPFNGGFYENGRVVTKSEILASAICSSFGLSSILYAACMTMLLVVWFATKTEKWN